MLCFFFLFINVAISACLCVKVLSYEVKTAASVPTGMLCSGRWRSELMLKPAMTPEQTNKQTHIYNMYIYIQCKAILHRKCKCDFDAENSYRLKRVDMGANLTCSSREEDPEDSKEVFSCTVIWHRVTAEQPWWIANEAVLCNRKRRHTNHTSALQFKVLEALRCNPLTPVCF